MNELKITPGPWRACTGSDKDSCICGQVWSTSRDYIVARVYREFNGAMEALPTAEEAKANAMLVAAAPDLYEVVGRLIEGGGCTCDDRAEFLKGRKCEVCAGHAALAKARGEKVDGN